MYSFAVRDEFAKLLYALLALVLLVVAQELLPVFIAVKPCLVLAAVVYSRSFKFAIAAGALVEAVEGLPFGCCLGLYSVVAVGGRILGDALDLIGRGAGKWAATLAGALLLLVFAPLAQVWLDAWVQPPNLVARFFASTVWAAPVGAVLFALAPRLEHYFGLDVPSTPKEQEE